MLNLMQGQLSGRQYSWQVQPHTWREHISRASLGVSGDLPLTSLFGGGVVPSQFYLGEWVLVGAGSLTGAREVVICVVGADSGPGHRGNAQL